LLTPKPSSIGESRPARRAYGADASLAARVRAVVQVSRRALARRVKASFGNPSVPLLADFVDPEEAVYWDRFGSTWRKRKPDSCCDFFCFRWDFCVGTAGSPPFSG
jgi:transposase-like protein